MRIWGYEDKERIFFGVLRLRLFTSGSAVCRLMTKA